LTDYTPIYTMRLQVLGLLLGLLSFVSARSAVGNKLLVVLEDEAEKSSYSHFCSDLEGEPCHIPSCY